MQEQAETILKPIIKLIQKGNSYEEILEFLSEKHLNTSNIEEILSILEMETFIGYLGKIIPNLKYETIKEN